MCVCMYVVRRHLVCKMKKKNENNAYVKAWGQIRCIMREVQAAYGILWQGIV